MMESQASAGSISVGMLQGSYESGRKIPLPTSQIPFDFKKKALDGFWAKKTYLTNDNEKNNHVGTVLSSLNRLLFYLYYLHFMEQETEARWDAVISPVSHSSLAMGAGTQTQDFWPQITAMDTLTEALRKRDEAWEQQRGNPSLGWVKVVPLESDLPMFHYPETAMSGKGRDPKRK